MLRPQYLQKIMIVFITLASVMLYIAEPTLAQRTNRKNSESSGSEQARQQQAEQARQQQAERARQQQAEQARQQQAERARQQQAERARQQQAEQVRQQQAERARQQQAEQARQQQAERARQQQAEQARQQQAERARQQQAERARQQQAEQARQQQAERARQQQAERARQQQAERARQQQAERARQQQAERARQQQAEQARQQQAERARQQQAEQARQQQAEQARQQQAERARQQQAEQARQQQAERARQQQAERARQQQAEQARQQQAEQARQQQAEQARQQQQSERINRKQQIASPDDRDFKLRTNDGTFERVNRKLPPLPTNTNTVIVDNSAPTASPIYRYELSRPSHLIYRDRPYATDTYRREHTYVDYSSRIRTRTITPSYRFTLCYNRGPWHTFRYFYPYYHRKYVFVSLGGYWPFNYRYIRYYWYGYHPYYWCGYYPIAREVAGSSYNYYTYNYYYDDNPISYQPTSTLESQYYDNIYQQPAEEPAGVTLADIYFEEAVKAFEESNYHLAIEKFAKAMELAPNDMILPFAYSQALFAAQRYTEATEVLRTAIAKITSDKEGVFYPRGLYPKDEVLFEQLDMLTEKAELYKFDADLQLLLGYQLLGLDQLDKAVSPLKSASLDLVNAKAATVLLGILEKIKTAEVQNENNITNYPESVITAPETKGAETETNSMSEIKFDDTQAECKITGSVYSNTRQDVTLLAVVFIITAVVGVDRYISG
jgi:hypothetical protein